MKMRSDCSKRDLRSTGTDAGAPAVTYAPRRNFQERFKTLIPEMFCAGRLTEQLAACRSGVRACALAALLVAAPLLDVEVAFAETVAPGLSIEINRLDAAGEDCRVTLVEKNATPTAVSTMKLDLAIFDKSDIVVKRVGVDAGPLRAGRSVVKTFDLKGLPCDGVGRFLLNDIIACEAGDLQADACLDMIEPRSRAVPFDK